MENEAINFVMRKNEEVIEMSLAFLCFNLTDSHPEVLSRSLVSGEGVVPEQADQA